VPSVLHTRSVLLSWGCASPLQDQPVPLVQLTEESTAQLDEDVVVDADAVAVQPARPAKKMSNAGRSDDVCQESYRSFATIKVLTFIGNNAPLNVSFSFLIHRSRPASHADAAPS
jgi:hypothetical protein